MGVAEIDGLQIHYHAPRDPARGAGPADPLRARHRLQRPGVEDHMATIAERHTPVAIDLPGHGRSSGRGFRGMADYAHVVMELGRMLGWDRFAVAGHSLGGGVAITAALYHPERLTGIILVDTGSAPARESRAAARVPRRRRRRTRPAHRSRVGLRGEHAPARRRCARGPDGGQGNRA